MLASSSLIFIPAARGADSPASESDETKFLSQTAEMNVHLFGKAVRFCASQNMAGGDLIVNAFEQYMTKVTSGMKAGLAEVNAAEWINGDEAFYPPEIVAMQIRQGEMIVQSIQAAPNEGCKKLSKTLDSGSEAFFKNFVVQSYREYQERRHIFCSKVPRPANCKSGE